MRKALVTAHADMVNLGWGGDLEVGTHIEVHVHWEIEQSPNTFPELAHAFWSRLDADAMCLIS